MISTGISRLVFTDQLYFVWMQNRLSGNLPAGDGLSDGGKSPSQASN
jgi:hypothetical protein